MHSHETLKRTHGLNLMVGWIFVFKWRSHDAVFLDCAHTALRFEVDVTSPVSYTILFLFVEIHKTFKANFLLPFSFTMNSFCKLLYNSLTLFASLLF